MLQIAIVEDEKGEAEVLKNYIARFEKENEQPCQVDVFSDGLAFLDGYKHAHDVIFMDIEMPHLNGMETAKRLRALNDEVPLVFVTNMKQYAIEGYSVSALDFILKPINYYRLASILKKLAKNVEKRGAEKYVRTEGRIIQVKLDSIYYIEVNGREIIYHTETQEIRTYGKLKDLEEEFASHGFVRCHHAYLINLKHIKSVDKDSVTVGNSEIAVSRNKRKDLLRAMGLYLGEI